MKIFTGVVTSKKMMDTATVVIERVVVHPLYKKKVKRTRKLHVHDELGSQVGQKVKFVASKPYSKTKRWKLIEIVNSAKGKPSSRAQVEGGQRAKEER